MSIKAKNDQKVHSRTAAFRTLGMILSIPLTLVIGCFSITGLVSFYQHSTYSGTFVYEIPAEILPTAAYLRDHPMPTPEGLSITNPKLIENRTQFQICVTDPQAKNINISSRFFLNGSRIPATFVKRSAADASPEDADPGTVSCMNVYIKQKGLYLIGFQRSIWSLDRIHQWTYEVR